jgi:hypothetical protein
VLLQTDWRINVYAYDRNYTKFSESFDVVRRSKPESYVYTETETLNYNTLLDKMTDIEENVAEVVNDYLEEHPVEVDLTGYATEDYVDTAINEIELTPGPAGKPGKDGYTPVKGVDYFDGKPGKDGEDYVLTEEDKAEIAGMVEVTGGGDVDLSDYYTKSETDDAIQAAVDAIEIPEGGGGDLPRHPYHRAGWQGLHRCGCGAVSAAGCAHPPQRSGHQDLHHRGCPHHDGSGAERPASDPGGAPVLRPLPPALR